MSDGAPSDDGWIKLCRRCSRHPDLRTFEEKGVWCDLLMLAASRSTTTMVNGVEVGLERGQLALVLTSWAAEHGISHQRLRAILAYFSKKQMIDLATVKGKAGTIVTICNYGIYQSLYRADGHQERPLSDSTRKTIQEEESESYPNVESPTSNVEPYPVVVTRAPTREETAAGAANDDGGGAQAVELDRERKTKRLASLYGLRGARPPSAARGDVETWASVIGWPRTRQILNWVFGLESVGDYGTLIDVSVANASTKVEAAKHAAVQPVLDPNLEALKRGLSRPRHDPVVEDDDGYVDPADHYLAHQAPAGA
jgi:hypothetical protein